MLFARLQRWMVRMRQRSTAVVTVLSVAVGCVLSGAVYVYLSVFPADQETLRNRMARGDIEAGMELARTLLSGKPAEQADAVAILKIAAANGEASAALILGEAHARGQLQLPKRASTAKPLLSQALSAGIGSAYLPLGQLYVDGKPQAGAKQLGCEYLYGAAQTGNRQAVSEFLSHCNGVQFKPLGGALGPALGRTHDVTVGK
jgi:TPR repeat protein